MSLFRAGQLINVSDRPFGLCVNLRGICLDQAFFDFSSVHARGIGLDHAVVSGFVFAVYIWSMGQTNGIFHLKGMDTHGRK